MSDAPEVSVVMGVYNGASGLRETMDSILAQEGVTFEFIIVDDGSTDGTQKILAEYQRRDPRVRCIRQNNQGLTRALIAGCNVARGEFIARQDCDDISFPDRLTQQVARLRGQPHAVMVSCGTQFVGPEREHLYCILQDETELSDGLSQLSLNTIKGPSHHGSTMFRRDVYHAVGGYRAQFRVAQDLDLWMRLYEIGACVTMPVALYYARLTNGGISSERRGEQLTTAQAIITCARSRRSGVSDLPPLTNFEQTHKAAKTKRSFYGRKMAEAQFNYFIGSVLRVANPNRACYYFLKSIRSFFLFAPPWVGIIRLVVRK